jgi:hypothetical protein
MKFCRIFYERTGRQDASDSRKSSNNIGKPATVREERNNENATTAGKPEITGKLATA